VSQRAQPCHWCFWRLPLACQSSSDTIREDSSCIADPAQVFLIATSPVPHFKRHDTPEIDL